MTDIPGRLFGILCLLLGVWVVTYWVYEPGDPGVTVGKGPAELTVTDAPGFQKRDSDTDPVIVETIDMTAPQRPRQVGDRIPPEFTSYTVQKGDLGFDSIAQRVYGDASLGEVISRANPFLPAERLYPGKTIIRIPSDPRNSRGRVVTNVSNNAGTSVVDPLTTNVIQMGTPPAQVPLSRPPKNAGAPAASTPPAATPKRVEYVIKSGDSLWKISKRFYGQGSKWRVIFDANRDVIPNADRPPLGVTIVIPPEPSSN